MLRLFLTLVCMTPLAGLLREGDCLNATSPSDRAALARLDASGNANAGPKWSSGARSLDGSGSLIGLFGDVIGGGGSGGDLGEHNSVIGQLMLPFGGPRRTGSRAAASTTSTTTTTSTTPAPLLELGDNIQTLGNGFIEAPIKMINTPLKVINRFAKEGSSSLDRAAESLANPLRPGFLKEPFDDSKYYEYTGPLEPFSYRRPKYFSRECPFRFACEVGKLVKPFTHQLSTMVETNKFMQDLQNRYTRAMTYGSLFGECERYYCVLVKLMGGPVGFASGVAEIVNAVMNKDDAEGASVSIFAQSSSGV